MSDGRTPPIGERFVAEGRHVRRAPLVTKNADGSKSISIGFIVLTVSEWVDDNVSEMVAAALNERELRGVEA